MKSLQWTNLKRAFPRLSMRELNRVAQYVVGMAGGSAALGTNSSLGPHSRDPAPVPTFRWYKVKTSWSLSAHSLVELYGYDIYSAKADDSLVIYGRLWTPWDRVVPLLVEGVNLQANDIVAGVPFLEWRAGAYQGKECALLICAPVLAGTSTAPHNILPTGANFEQEAADLTAPTTWDRTDPPVDTFGVKIRVQTRMAYNHAGDEKLYAYYREMLYDSAGRLRHISAEVRVEIDAPEDCAV